MKTHTVCIIDDCFNGGEKKTSTSTSRSGIIETLSKRESLEIITIPSNDLAEIKGALSDNDAVDLVIIDFKLKDSFDNQISLGSELVSIVRHLCRDTAVYLLSVDIGKDSEFFRVEGFERIIGNYFLSEMDVFESEVKDLSLIKTNIENENIEDLVKCLAGPTVIEKDLIAALPTKVKSQVSNNKFRDAVNTGANVEFLRWLMDWFYPYPGFLLDQQSCALLVGAEVEYFAEKVASSLEDCRYKGVLHKSLEKRWWKSCVEKLIFEKDDENLYDGSKLSQHHFSEILAVPESKRSRCVVCKELWPDSLAYFEDDDCRELHFVHSRCSNINIDISSGPYFFKPRIICDESSSN